MDIIRKKKQNIKNYKEYFSKNEDFYFSEEELKCHTYKFGHIVEIEKEDVPVEYSSDIENENDKFIPSGDIYNDFDKESILDIADKNNSYFSDNNFKGKRSYFGWLVLAPLMLVFLIFGNFYIKKSLNAKKQVLGTSQVAYENINQALDSIEKQDFTTSSNKFNEAYENFSEMSDSLEGLGKGIISISRFIPGASKLSSGYNITEAGKNLSLAGKKISQMAKNINSLKDNNNPNEKKDISLSETFLSFDKDFTEVNRYLLAAQDNLNKVKISDIPSENQKEVLDLKNKLPVVAKIINDFSANSHLIADLLGSNGPRKYLFLFQNNQEIRATGGFIGSYGVLDIDGNGKIRKFFIDGIFNPDGQLIDRIVPPKPIQKISAAWSLHDSNWFPDFPISARKAISFYEKTGGPTVDGVITLTPAVMQKLLDITGPIEMKEYGVVLTKDNFIENIQYEVEEDYDKSENKPKKILSDLAPIVLDKILNSKDVSVLAKAINVFEDALEEKHVLFYFSNSDLQEVISNLGWSGEMLKSSGDYLSVINTNINGYKTDGIVNEKIQQKVEISENGEIIDTVSITRKHNGGNTKYEWWNKVSSDYMRVYVPQGSVLLSVDGQTREINEDVLDYESLGFEKDLDVENEESQMTIDENSGTRIYSESGKTVFANWVYVSPQEEVTVTYKYLLPFKFDISKGAGNYSILNQKQSGSMGDDFNFSINYPKSWKEEWGNNPFKSCSSDRINYNQSCLDGNLKKDSFIGVVFSNN